MTAIRHLGVLLLALSGCGGIYAVLSEYRRARWDEMKRKAQEPRDGGGHVRIVKP